MNQITQWKTLNTRWRFNKVALWSSGIIQLSAISLRNALQKQHLELCIRKETSITVARRYITICSHFEEEFGEHSEFCFLKKKKTTTSTPLCRQRLFLVSHRCSHLCDTSHVGARGDVYRHYQPWRDSCLKRSLDPHVCLESCWILFTERVKLVRWEFIALVWIFMPVCMEMMHHILITTLF